MYFPILALCPDLKDPDNGKLVIMTGTLLGDTAGFICNSGFELMGSETVTCQDDGQWSDSAPTCQIIGTRK